MLEGSNVSRFVRFVCVSSSHQVASGVLHLLQIVVEVRCTGRGWLHSAQSMVGELVVLRGKWRVGEILFSMSSVVG